MSDDLRNRVALLPCPFCGGDAAFERLGSPRQSCIVSCDNCGCRLEANENWDFGTAWNTRADAALAAMSGVREEYCAKCGAPRSNHPYRHPFEARKSMRPPVEMSGAPLQDRVSGWMQDCFGPEISSDRLVRGDRLLEEVFELLQSGDYPRERVAALREYVWNRPKGEPEQEVGGVMLTLAAYCLAHEINMHEAGEREIDRVTQPEVVLKIRAKQAAKPTGSALPIAATEPAHSVREAARDEGSEMKLAYDAYRKGQRDALDGIRVADPRVILSRVRATAEGKDDE